MEDIIYEELLEATYGFCLKNLSNPDDAEELTQDIICEALKARGKSIDNFYAWYWKMAKNRISRFYRIKQNGAVLIDEYINVPSFEPEIDSNILAEEEVNKLNYSISRLSNLHRNVIIMYYLREMSVSDIAKELGVPEGTVKRRLFDARTDIKKGMEDMTGYGRASYAPAEVNLFGGYQIVKHWPKLSNAMVRQIFACCAFEAKTVKEIADEIGCAPLYFEESLCYLLENRFIKEISKGKYIIDFCLIPAQIDADARYEISLAYKDIGREITALIKQNELKIRNIDFYGADMPFGELLWFLYYVFAVALQCNMDSLNERFWEGKVPKNNGKDYRLAGTLRMPDENIVNRQSSVPCALWSNYHHSFMTSRYSEVIFGNIFTIEPFGDRSNVITDSNIDLFMRIFDDPFLKLTENEKFNASNLVKSGFIKEKDGGLYPAMPVLDWRKFMEIRTLAQELTVDIAKKYHDIINEISNRILLPVIRKDLLEEYAHLILSQNFFPITYFYGYGINNPESGLALPDDYNNTPFATYMTYKK